MEKEFIPYEQALALKELGFDEECFAYYNLKEEITFKSCHNRVPIIMSGKKCGIPLYQQAFRWFREKHGLKFHIKEEEYQGERFEYGIRDFIRVSNYKTFEQAEIACVVKLVEIVNEKV